MKFICAELTETHYYEDVETELGRILYRMVLIQGRRCSWQLCITGLSDNWIDMNEHYLDMLPENSQNMIRATMSYSGDEDRD